MEKKVRSVAIADEHFAFGNWADRARVQSPTLPTFLKGRMQPQRSEKGNEFPFLRLMQISIFMHTNCDFLSPLCNARDDIYYCYIRRMNFLERNVKRS